MKGNKLQLKYERKTRLRRDGMKSERKKTWSRTFKRINCRTYFGIWDHFATTNHFWKDWGLCCFRMVYYDDH